MLFDKGKKRITAILDFDWSYISNPFEEFETILSEHGCNITHADNEISAAMLSGDFTTPPSNVDEEFPAKWEFAKAWNAAMKRNGVVSPSDIKGVEQIRDMVRLEKMLCPYQLSSESALKHMNGDEKTELLAMAEANIVQWLEKHGF
jgi:hypothetical protein